MKIVRQDRYIRVDILENTDAQIVIQEIKKHIDGIYYVGESWDNCYYSVNGIKFNTKADTILDILNFSTNFEDEYNIIDAVNRNCYQIGCSKIKNDTSNDSFKTNRTRYNNKNIQEIINILVEQPYIYFLSSNINKELQDALHILSEEIIKAKEKEKYIFSATIC